MYRWARDVRLKRVSVRAAAVCHRSGIAKCPVARHGSWSCSSWEDGVAARQVQDFTRDYTLFDRCKDYGARRSPTTISERASSPRFIPTEISGCC